MEENKELIGIIITLGAGAFAILASIFDWDFFFEHRKAQILMKWFGRKGARIFYAVLGLVLFYLAYGIITK